MKKIFRLMSLAAAVTILVTGCGGSEDKTVSTNTEGTVGEYTISEKPIELSMFFTNTPKLEETEVWQEIAKLTNVSLKTVSSQSADNTQALNTMLMSGEIPDLVVSTGLKSIANEYGPEGAFAPIDELAEKYQCENLLKYLNNPKFYSFTKANDGHVYYMSGVNPETVGAGWFIRQDWLDKLGLQAPTTVDEYYTVLKAFREQDPNGNGLKDEVPYFSRFSSVGDLFTLWDAYYGWNQKDGKIFFGPAEEEYKLASKNVAKWYAEGLIDKEIYTRGGKSRDKLLGENIGGSTHDWFGSTAQFNDILAEQVPGLRMVAFAPPTGKEYSIRTLAMEQGAAIGANSENQEIAIKLLDFMFSEKGGHFANFGLEGNHYDLVDGKPIFRDWVVNGDKTAINILNEAGSCTVFPYVQDFSYEEQWMNEDAVAGAQMYINNNYLVPAFPPLSYDEETHERLNKIMTDIDTYFNEMTQSWVFGSKDVDATWEEYLENLEKLGLSEAIEIQQKAYDEYIKLEK